MTQKNTIALVATLILISGVIFYNTQKSTLPITSEPQTEQIPETPEITEVTEVASDINTDIDNIEMPASFKDVEMTTHKSEYGFEVTYPKGWIFKDATESFYRKVSSHIFIRTFESSPYDNIWEVISVTVEDSGKDSLEQGLQEYINKGYDPSSLKSLSELEEVNLNGNTGFKKVRRQIKESLIEDFEGNAPYYFFLKNGKLYTIRYTYQPEQKITEEEALWVLSTFKIVN